MAKVYSNVGRRKPGRSVFDLSHRKVLTCDMGELIPTLAMDCIPGDIFSIGVQSVLRMRPLVAPVLHEINMYIHYFFVPYRILWDNDSPSTGSWEEFITGGVDGLSAPTFPVRTAAVNANSIWDYLGYPISVAMTGVAGSAMPVYSYNTIYNEYYRDQTQITEVSVSDANIKKRAWEKDYFTTALPWQQRGTAPALPISGIIDIDPKDTDVIVYTEGTPGTLGIVRNSGADDIVTNGTPPAGDLRWSDPAMQVDLSGATTFDVADLRLAFQIQKWLEGNARGGARYTEFLKMHFSASPRDERLDRPEYIGGIKKPIIISEVLQTSESNTTEQGTMAGHGLMVESSMVTKYRVQEHGIIMGIMSVMPRSMYSCQGVDRQWIKETKYDFYFPEFAHLSEQPVFEGELYCDGTESHHTTVFGYQGRYDEYRSMRSMAVAGMRTDFDEWHLARQFASRPALNQSFIECSPSKRIFAVESEDGLLVEVGNIIKAIRPMPAIADPGYLDH